MILFSYVLFISKVYLWLFPWSFFLILIISREKANNQVPQVLLKN